MPHGRDAPTAARPLLGNSDQAFQFIQEFSGFFTPGITVILLLGLFWKPTEAGAIVAAITSVLLSYILKSSSQWRSRCWVKGRGDANRVTMEGVSFRTTNAFNICSIGVVLILIALYATWW